MCLSLEPGVIKKTYLAVAFSNYFPPSICLMVCSEQFGTKCPGVSAPNFFLPFTCSSLFDILLMCIYEEKGLVLQRKPHFSPDNF